MKNLRFKHNFLRIATAGLVSLLLVACATSQPRNEAEFVGYGFRTVFDHVRDAKCAFGYWTNSVANEAISKEIAVGHAVTDGRSPAPDLVCTWSTLDGTPRKETVDMKTLLKRKVVKWDFTDVEVHRTEPFVMDPEVRVELRDKTLSVNVRAMVQYYGEHLPNGGRRIPYRIVTNTLLERSGQ